MSKSLLDRRQLLRLSSIAAIGVAAPGVLRAQAMNPDARTVAGTEGEAGVAQPPVRHVTASFRAQAWQDHFQHLKRGAILCDLQSRALHFWSEDQSTYLVYPSSVPMNDDLTMRGYTEITLKRRDPTWIPTPSMRAKDPDLPASVGPGPDNPMGSRALNLGWQYYRIHGIDNLAKIGRPASNGCVGLYNPNVERLFDLVQVGTQVRFL